MRNTDNTPGQMEATASTAEGKNRKPIYAPWDLGLGENETVCLIQWGNKSFVGRVKLPPLDFSNAIIIDNKA